MMGSREWAPDFALLVHAGFAFPIKFVFISTHGFFSFTLPTLFPAAPRGRERASVWCLAAYQTNHNSPLKIRGVIRITESDMIVEDTFTYSLGKPWAELNYGADLSPSLSFWLLCAYAFLASSEGRIQTVHFWAVLSGLFIQHNESLIHTRYNYTDLLQSFGKQDPGARCRS